MSSGYDDRDDDRDDRRRDDRGPDRAEAARQRVGLPAVFILLNGVFGLGVVAFLFVVLVANPDAFLDWLKGAVAAQPAGKDKQENEEKIKDLEDKLKGGDQATRVAVNVAELGVMAALNLAAIIGALKMRGGSHGWGLAASIISLIPCATGCCCTGLPFGIWGLVVLVNEDVKDGLRAGRPRPADDGYAD